MLHVEMVRQFGAVAHEIAYLLRRLTHILRRFVTVGGVVQHTVFQQVVLEISGVQLADKRAVHVEGGDAVRRFDVIG